MLYFSPLIRTQVECVHEHKLVALIKLFGTQDKGSMGKSIKQSLTIKIFLILISSRKQKIPPFHFSWSFNFFFMGALLGRCQYKCEKGVISIVQSVKTLLLDENYFIQCYKYCTVLFHLHRIPR